MSSLLTGRTVILLVGLVLVVAGVAATSSPQSRAADDPINNPVPPSIAQPSGTTSYLQVPDSDTQTDTITRVSVNVAAATRISADQVELQLAIESFRSRFESANTEAERTAAVREIVRVLDSRTEALRERQQTALAQYNSGKLSKKQFIGTLTHVGVTAEAIENAASTVRAKDENTLDYSIPPSLETRLRNFRARVLPLSGQIRRHILQPVVTGSSSSRPVYLGTGDNEIVLATITSNRYAREAFSNETFNPNGSPNLTIYLDAINRTKVLYPWAMSPENLKQNPRTETLLNGSVFNVNLAHKQGEMDIYLDASTTNVFREDQSRELSKIPVRTVATNATAKVQLEVNGTHETGPLRVALTRPGTSIPVADTAVYVNGTYVGTTGQKGVVWTIDTRGATTVRAETAAGTVLTARIDPLSN